MRGLVSTGSTAAGGMLLSGFRRAIALALAAGLAMSPAGAADWRLSGSQTLRVETFRAKGDPAQRPYAHTGIFATQELALSLAGTTAPGETWQFDLAGVATNSPYRSPYVGITPEVLRLVHENTNGPMPFRVELGDQTVQFSALTLNQPMRAGRVSLQPASGRDGRRYSVSAVAGSNGPWRHDGPSERFQGLSLRMDDNALGSLGVHVVRSRRQAQGEGLADGQWVGSFTAGRAFDLAGQKLKLSGEWAYLQTALGGDTPDTKRHGRGLWLQLDGADDGGQLDYHLRYDRYGKDFQPNGAELQADSQAGGAELGWRLRSGPRISGRVQQVQEYRSTADPLRTTTVGVAVEGSLRPHRPDAVKGRIGLTHQRQRSKSGAVDANALTLEAGVGVRHSERHESRLNLSLSKIDDARDPSADRQIRQLALSHRARFQAGPVALTVTPGIAVSHDDGPDGATRMGPALTVEASTERQKLSLQLGQDRFESDQNGIDSVVDQRHVGVRYEFRQGRHTFGADVERSSRDTPEGEGADGWRAGMFWRFDFDRRSEG